MSSSVKKLTLSVAAALAASWLAAATALAQATPANPPLSVPDPDVSVGSGTSSAEGDSGVVAPLLSIPIPTINLTKPAGSEEYIDIPWLADYLTGAYKYLLGIGAFIAAVMMIIAGAQWLTAGGDAGKVTKARSRITNAILGLVLLFGTYLLLVTVNPDLVSMKPLRIAKVEQVLFTIEYSLMTTNEETSPSGDASSGGEIAGSHVPTYADCPVKLTKALTDHNPSKDERANEFFSKIGAVVQGGSVADRIVKIADAASKCGVEFGSCGRTAGTIYALAGGTSRSCIDNKTDCNTWPKTKKKSIDRDQVIFTVHALCKTADQVKKMSADELKQWGQNLPDCVENDKGAAKKKVFEKFQSEIKGYPDEWTNSLQPGDWIIFYNGNSSYSAAHSVIFLGWGQNGRAQIIGGSYEKTVKVSSVCLTSACDSPAPLMRIFSP